MSQLLQAISDATPEPPSPDADPGDVLSVAEAITRQRSALLRELQEFVQGGGKLDADALSLLELVCERDTRWSAALAHARYEISLRLGAVRRGY